MSFRIKSTHSSIGNNQIQQEEYFPSSSDSSKTVESILNNTYTAPEKKEVSKGGSKEGIAIRSVPYGQIDHM